MAKAPPPTHADITQRRDTLRSRRTAQIEVMQNLEPWEHRDGEALYTTIWRGKPPDNPERWTVVKPDIAATVETVTSFLSARRPHIMVSPKESVRKQGKDAANAVERLGYALWDTIDRDRQQSLLSEAARSCISRGEMIAKILWLSPEERGEVSDTVEASDTAIGLDGNEPTTVYDEQGEFPLLPQFLDPMECYFSIGKGDRLLHFIHEFSAPGDYLLDLFPDLADHPDFRQITSTSTNSYTVIDYWDREYNAILIDNRFYKEPTPHEYPDIPIVVELAKPRYRRTGQNLGPSMIGQPFCAHMLDAIIDLSWADSVSKMYLANLGYGNYVLENVDPDTSIRMRQENGKSIFDMQIDTGPGGQIIPTFMNDKGGERLVPLQPPPLVDHMQEFKGARARDAALVSFHEAILSGQMNIDLSGYAVAQMKQATMARVAPYELALNRFLSRFMQMSFRIMAHEWDRGEDAEMILTELVSAGRGAGQRQVEQEVPISREMLAQIGTVRVEIDPEIPTNREQEITLLIQMFTTGLISAETFLEESGVVQDPSKEIDRVMFETMARQDPQIMAAVAMKYMKDNGIMPATPNAPAAPPMGAAPPIDPAMMGGQPPMDPSMMGMDPAMALAGGGAPMPNGGGGGQLPPELLAIMQGG